VYIGFGVKKTGIRFGAEFKEKLLKIVYGVIWIDGFVFETTKGSQESQGNSDRTDCVNCSWNTWHWRQQNYQNKG